MMVSKITYLLGAGASAGALPTVANLPGKLILFYKKISDQRNFKDLPDKSRGHIRLLQAKTWEVLQALVQNTEKWGENFSGFTEKDSTKIPVKHASVDTYAKRLFITNDEKLTDLKIVLTAFFEYEQSVNHIDIRYDHFLASIIPDYSKIFPDNVRVLTWNYDRQFELAYKPYQGDSAGLKIISKGLVKPTEGKKTPGFQIIKLNGMATCVDFKQHKIANSEAINAFARVAEVASDLLSNGLQSGISFAWEADQGEILQKAKEVIGETDILIVIGYSFPFFNRQIDREILKSVDLSTLYIQDYSPQGVKERFVALYGNGNVKTVAIEPGQFFIPNEFD